MSPQLQQMGWISGGGAEAAQFARGLVLWMLFCGMMLLIPTAYRAHRRGMERIRRMNERNALKHARRSK